MQCQKVLPRGPFDALPGELEWIAEGIVAGSSPGMEKFGQDLEAAVVDLGRNHSTKLPVVDTVR